MPRRYTGRLGRCRSRNPPELGHALPVDVDDAGRDQQQRDASQLQTVRWGVPWPERTEVTRALPPPAGSGRRRARRRAS